MRANIPALVSGLSLAAGLVAVAAGIAGYGIAALLYGIGMALLAIAQEIRNKP